MFIEHLHAVSSCRRHRYALTFSLNLMVNQFASAAQQTTQQKNSRAWNNHLFPRESVGHLEGSSRKAWPSRGSVCVLRQPGGWLIIWWPCLGQLCSTWPLTVPNRLVCLAVAGFQESAQRCSKPPEAWAQNWHILLDKENPKASPDSEDWEIDFTSW